MIFSKISHDIKHRKTPNNDFETPIKLVKFLILQTPIKKNYSLLDSAYGSGNFYKNFPKANKKEYTKDFFNYHKKADLIITNPPYSDLDNWIKHTCELSQKGFCLLIGLHNLTPRRIEIIEKHGFGIKKIILFKVFKWFGISAYIICLKDSISIIKYNREVFY